MHHARKVRLIKQRHAKETKELFVDESDLSERTKTELKQEGIETLDQFVGKTAEEIDEMPIEDIGPVRSEEIEKEVSKKRIFWPFGKKKS